MGKNITEIFLVTLGSGIELLPTSSPIFPSSKLSVAAEPRTIKKKDLDKFLVVQVALPNGESLNLRQGFGSLIGKAATKEDGDRTGFNTWPGGVELGADLLTNRLVDVNGKRVIDLGTGTGIVGISAVLAGAKEVALTDGAPEVLEIVGDNVESNLAVKLKGNVKTMAEGLKGTKSKIGVGRLRWGNENDINNWLQWHIGSSNNLGRNTIFTKKYDYVLASEVAYEHKNIKSLLDTIKILLEPENGKALLRLTKEITDDAKGFDDLISTMKSKGFQIVAFPRLTENDNSQVFLLKM